MLVKIFSVPHTGTHFVKELLEAHGLQVKAKHVEGYKDDEEIIILPVRDPEATCKSWSARGRRDGFIERWEKLNEISQNPNAHILPIDTDDRDEYLKALSKVLNVELNTDWYPVNQFNRIGQVDINIDEVYAIPLIKSLYRKEEKKPRGRPKKVKQ